MISQGTDGLSRGDHSEGVMRGQAMEHFIPLHLHAFERSPTLKAWFQDVLGTTSVTYLDPKGWYTKAHTFGNLIWFPPPVAADVVVEQLDRARHKRPSCMHLIAVPRLMTGQWRCHLTRDADCYFLLRDCSV
jgi:hypothetical protein